MTKRLEATSCLLFPFSSFPINFYYSRVSWSRKKIIRDAITRNIAVKRCKILDPFMFKDNALISFKHLYKWEKDMQGIWSFIYEKTSRKKFL